ncbi:MAG: homoserine kinase [Limnochordaceae bacterium]|nr:homoserine kinase [Limnochordaceae bacterium]
MNGRGRAVAVSEFVPVTTRRPSPARFRVFVPATTANLGPGFDTLGLALDLGNELEVEILADHGNVEPGGGTDVAQQPAGSPEGQSNAPFILEVYGEGADQLGASHDNLLVKALQRGWQRWGRGRGLPPLRLICRNEIPLGSGLGSSAAAIVMGLATAWALAWWVAGCQPRLAAAATQQGEDRCSTAGAGTIWTIADLPAAEQDELLSLAYQLEGHPDNVAAALYGGFTVALALDGPGKLSEERLPRVWVERLDVSSSLWGAVVTPSFPLSTGRSRQVLPETVARQDAVFNLARLAWLVAAMAKQDWARVGEGLVDRLHQPYRVRLVPGLADVLAAGRQAGALGATLSGAGPSAFALAPDHGRAEAAGQAMQRAFSDHQVEAQVRVVKVGTMGLQWYW